MEPLLLANVVVATNKCGTDTPYSPCSVGSTADTSCSQQSPSSTMDTSSCPHRSSCFQQVDDTDIAQQDDDLLGVEEYADEIRDCLRESEHKIMPKSDYMSEQHDLKIKFRAILVDWLSSVQRAKKMRPVTIHLAVRILDQFLSVRLVVKSQLQCVGLACLLIAAKQEETEAIEIADCVYLADNSFTKDELKKMELVVATALQFNLCLPTVLHFLEDFQKLNRSSELQRNLLGYLVELSMVDYRILQYPPSIVAAAAILLANKLMKVHPSWSPAMTKDIGYTVEQIRPCAKELCAVYENAESNTLQAVRKKYSSPEYQSVATKKIGFDSLLQQPSARPSL